MDSILNHRSLLDWRILLEEFLFFDWLAVGGVGLLIGLVVAHRCFYRSAGRIRQLENERADIRRRIDELGEEEKPVTPPERVSDLPETEEMVAEVNEAGPGADDEAEAEAEAEAQPEETAPPAESVPQESVPQENVTPVPVPEPPEEEFRMHTVYSREPSDADDLTLLAGIDGERAAEMRAAGIYKFSQLEELDEGDRRKFAFKFGWGDIDWDSWMTVAAASAAMHVSDRKGEEDGGGDPEEPGGVNPIAAAVEEDFEPLTTAEEESEDFDDLTLLEGIDREQAAEMRAAGIHRFSQLADLDEEGRRKFEFKFGWDRINWDAWMTVAGGAAALAAVTGAKESRSEQGRETTGGERYSARPDDADDLTELEGINAERAAALNRAGIYKFSQLAELDEEERNAFGMEFGWTDINWKAWGTVAATGGAVAAETFTDRSGEEKTEEDWSEVMRKRLEESGDRESGEGGKLGWEEIDWEKWEETEETEETEGMPVERGDVHDGATEPIRPPFGYLHPAQPDDVDDLTEINEIDPVLEKRLNDLGVYQISQIAQWDEENVEAFEDAIGSPGRIAAERWVVQARELSGSVDPGIDEIEPEKPARSEYGVALADFHGEEVEVDENFGIVYTSPPAETDDLKRVRGIGRVIEGKLNGRGVYRFGQIAHWNDYNIWAFGRDLAFPGRITREEWVQQAKALAAGEEPEEGIVGIRNIAVPAGVAPVPTGEPVTVTGTEGAKQNRIFGIGEEGDEEVAVIPPVGKTGFSPPQPVAHTRRVVYVMDVSKSLTPAQLNLSKTELVTAVRALPPNSLYQVIFFSGPAWFADQRMVEGGARGEDVVIEDGETKLRWSGAFGGFEFEEGNDSLPGGEWREASRENIALTLEDIVAVDKSYGTTWHLPLTMALNLEPAPTDIYFLTDGETARQDQIAGEMVELARKRGGTRIHTIALMVPGASLPLHQIAEGTGGEYSLVIAGGRVLRGEELREYLAEKGIMLPE